MPGMFGYLRQLAARLRGGGFGPLFPPTDDPDAAVREPRRRDPGGRSSAVAVEEPREDALVDARPRAGSRRSI
jgi:hypothetical protein